MARLLTDATIGGYIPTDSWVHRLDPRTKLLATVLVLIVIFWNQTGFGIGIISAMVALSAIGSRVGWRIWLWGLGRFKWMLALTAIFNLWFHRGGEAIQLLGFVLPVTRQALLSSLLLTGQLLDSILISLILTFTTSPLALTRACAWFAMPLKFLRVPVEEISLVLLLALRFVPAFQQEVRAVVEAQRARGVEFGRGNLLNRVRNLAAVLVPALLLTWRRGEHLATAMTVRGFRPNTQRSSYRPLRFRMVDGFVFLCLALIIFFSYLL